MDLVAYIRVSSEHQGDGFGPDVQEDSIRSWAKANGHTMVAVCRDLGVSGTKPAGERPGLSEALDMVRPPPADVRKRRAAGLVVARLDRLARELTIQEVILSIVWRDDGSVFTADYGEVLADDPDDPMRTAMRQMAGVFAQLDRALITKRLRDGRKAKAATGRHSVGQYRFGYHGVGEGKARDAAPHPDEQAAIERIIELRNGGRSYREIATQLDEEGIRPRRAEHWSAMQARNIAARELTDTSTDASDAKPE